jgi:hypothetical protein
MRTGYSESLYAPATSLSTLWDRRPVPARATQSTGRHFPDHILFHGVRGVNTTLVPFVCRRRSALLTSTLPCRSPVQLPPWRTARLATYRDRYDQGLISRSAPTFLESPGRALCCKSGGKAPSLRHGELIVRRVQPEVRMWSAGGVDPRHGGVTRNAENAFNFRCELSRKADLPRAARAWRRSRRRTFARWQASACPGKWEHGLDQGSVPRAPRNHPAITAVHPPSHPIAERLDYPEQRR